MLNSFFRGLLGTEESPTKVLEVRSDNYLSRPIYYREDSMLLYGPQQDSKNSKDKYFEIVLHKPFTESLHQMYSLYRSNTKETSEEKFIVFKERVPLYIKITKECSVQSLQKLCDLLSTHQSWSIAHIVAHFSQYELFNDPLVQRCINDVDPLTGATPIMVAVKTCNVRMVQSLVSLNCSLDTVDNEGNTVFHYAAASNKEIINALASKTATSLNVFNKHGYTPLHMACLANAPDCVRALMVAGADVNLTAAKRSTSSLPGLVGDVLQDNQPKLYQQDMKHGGTPLHWAISREVIEALVDKNCDMNALNFDGRTALHVMVFRGRLECAIALLARGAEINTGDKDGNTPLHLAVKQSNISMVQALVVFGADLEAVSNAGFTARHTVPIDMSNSNFDKILYILHAVGAKRCAEDVQGCGAGCSARGDYNGVPPPPMPGAATRDAISQMLSVAAMERAACMDDSQKQGRLLCLDGGGIRGLVLIQILLSLEEVVGQPIIHCFDWVAGTSTGGILALALASGKTLRECQRLYFRMKEFAFVGMRPYPSEPLETILKECLGTETVMADIDHPKLMILAVLADRKPVDLHIFRNYQSAQVILDAHNGTVSPLAEAGDAVSVVALPEPPPPAEQLVWQAARATGAAPSYFRASGSRLLLWGQPVKTETDQPSRSLQESENKDPCASLSNTEYYNTLSSKPKTYKKHKTMEATCTSSSQTPVTAEKTYGSSNSKRRKLNCLTPVIESNLLQVEIGNNSSGLESLSSKPKTYQKQKPMEATCTSSSQTPVTAKNTQIWKVNWPLPDPSVDNHLLQIEIVSPSDNFSGLDGYRVMDIKHVLQWAFAIASHKQVCTCANIVFVNEKKHGLQSTFLFKCTMCGKQWEECSEKVNKKKELSRINKSFVWGTITSGSFFTQTEHLMGIMDIPTMNAAAFQKMEDQLGDIWLEHLTEEIQKAGEMEKAIAIAKGDIDDDGVPFTTVCVDGGWPKRSYGHNYKSASGMACIIGVETKKCLFLGIKYKYCFHCQHYEKKEKEIPPHQCFKNFDGPSSSMEAAILVEGFQRSEEMHGMRYRAFIGDGDSSVFYQLKEKVSYGKTIKKIECKNHVIKNYTNALYKILSNTKLPLTGRNLLKPKLTKLTVVARKIIIRNAGNPSNMRRDLKNGPFHVFGKHNDCSDYYCRYKGSPANPDVEPLQDEDLTEKMKKEATTVWALIIAANEAVTSKAARLSNATTNIAENFMSVINKFNCGKRLDLCKGGSYQRRVQVAGLQHASGYEWHNAAWRKCSPRSPGKYFKTYIARKELSRMRQKMYSRKRLFLAGNKKQQQPDEHYGPAAMDPVDEMDSTELKRLCLEKLQEFQKAPGEIKNIELSTIGQHDNDLYNLHRNDRLTASLFGMICKRKRSTPCHNHVKQILYKSNFSTSDTAYGQQNESVARTIFAEKHGKTVREAGLFIDEEYGFLGASPDGVIESENAIIEVKTFPSLSRSAQDIQTAAKERKNFSLCFKDGMLQMNKKHNYFYQVQGQLRVTKMTKCYLVCFISPVQPITVLEVLRDDAFILEMIDKLKSFFEKFVLPEIVLRRIPKNAKCLEPAEENANNDK